MYRHLLVGVAIALAVFALGGAQASARDLAKRHVAHSNAAVTAKSLEPFYHQATWKNSRF